MQKKDKNYKNSNNRKENFRTLGWMIDYSGDNAPGVLSTKAKGNK